MNRVVKTPEQEGQHRMGKGMIIASWIGLLVVLTLLFQGYLERQENPNMNPESSAAGQIVEVVLERNRAGHYVASGLINGSPVTFLLDTGATDVAISDELASALGLPRMGRVTSQTANGPVTAWKTRLTDVGIGGIREQDVSASILPSLHGGEVLLGMSFLQRLEMIQRGKHLLLRQHQ